MEIFDIVKNIFTSKEPLILEELSEYTPYVANMALARYIDTILYASQMNQNAHLPKHMQYDYLFHSVRKHKRPFHPWDKQVKNSDIDMIKECYKVSTPKAKEFIKVLTSQQLNIIKERTVKGGS